MEERGYIEPAGREANRAAALAAADRRSGRAEDAAMHDSMAAAFFAVAAGADPARLAAEYRRAESEASARGDRVASLSCFIAAYHLERMFADRDGQSG